MRITHEKAHQLIQWKSDHWLDPQQAATLSAHLRDCGECQAYANEIQEVEDLLVSVMRRQWHRRPVPLSVATLLGKNLRSRTGIMLTMRMAAVGLVVMFFFFSVWQFGPSSPILPSQMPQAIPPALTSVLTAQSPRAQLTREGCVLLPYIVRENDSLAAIATQFAISETMILEINQLEADSIRPGMELQIPLCDFTPTGTSHAATSTITDTPVLYLTISTPGG